MITNLAEDRIFGANLEDIGVLGAVNFHWDDRELKEG